MRLFFFFYVESYNADKYGDKAEHLANDCTDSEICNVIGEPRGRADKTETADGSCVFKAKPDVSGCHAHDGQKLDYSVEKRKILAEDGEGEDIRRDVKENEAKEPRDMVGVKFFLVHIDKGAENGNDVHDAADYSAEHKKVYGEKRRAEKLKKHSFFICFLLKGKNIEGHCQYANGLGCYFKRVHNITVPIYFCNEKRMSAKAICFTEKVFIGEVFFLPLRGIFIIISRKSVCSSRNGTLTYVGSHKEPYAKMVARSISEA